MARIEGGSTLVTGGIQAAGTGAALGSVGGSVGMGVGAGIAGAASLGAGLTDMLLMNRKFAEQASMTRDNFMYSTGNIAARPDTIASVGSFTNSNKLVPYIEVYDCTDIEKDAFREFLKYNGMSFNRISTIQDALSYRGTDTNPFLVQGRTMRTSTHIYGDSHGIQELVNTLSGGIYIE